jgi:hypothetical protein
VVGRLVVGVERDMVKQMMMDMIFIVICSAMHM